MLPIFCAFSKELEQHILKHQPALNICLGETLLADAVEKPCFVPVLSLIILHILKAFLVYSIFSIPVSNICTVLTILPFYLNSNFTCADRDDQFVYLCVTRGSYYNLPDLGENIHASMSRRIHV